MMPFRIGGLNSYGTTDPNTHYNKPFHKKMSIKKENARKEFSLISNFFFYSVQLSSTTSNELRRLVMDKV